MVEYRKHVGIEAYNSNSNSSKLYVCVQLLCVKRNTGSAVGVAVYRFENYTDDRSTHNQFAEGLNIAKGRNTAIMASGQNSQKQWKSVLNNLKLFRFHNSTVFVAKHRKDGASENSKSPRQRITGSALAVQCCKAHALITLVGKWEIRLL